MNQQMCSALGLRLQVTVGRLSVTVNAVVNIQWNHVVCPSVRKCKDRWGWNAVVVNRGAQSPAANIIAIDMLWLLRLCHWYKSGCGGVVVKVDAPCHALVYQFCCRCEDSGDAFLIQVWNAVLRW